MFSLKSSGLGTKETDGKGNTWVHGGLQVMHDSVPENKRTRAPSRGTWTSCPPCAPTFTALDKRSSRGQGLATRLGAKKGEPGISCAAAGDAAASTPSDGTRR